MSRYFVNILEFEGESAGAAYVRVNMDGRCLLCWPEKGIERDISHNIDLDFCEFAVASGVWAEAIKVPSKILLTPSLIRSRARAVLSDGEWTHNFYSKKEMEDLIVRVMSLPKAK